MMGVNILANSGKPNCLIFYSMDLILSVKTHSNVFNIITNTCLTIMVCVAAVDCGPPPDYENAFYGFEWNSTYTSEIVYNCITGMSTLYCDQFYKSSPRS